MHDRSTPRPTPQELTRLRPSNAAGVVVLTLCLALSCGAFWLSLQPNVLVWALGQVLLGLSLVQWFAVLHECGHDNLFRAKWPHAFVGPIAGFFSLIPFYNWKRIHGRHHKWTGWQDVDPTTASLVPRPLGRAERVLVNVCWKCWIPLFSLIYRVNNFWNMQRLRSLFPKPQERRRFAASSIVLVATYIIIVALIGPATAFRSVGAGLLLAFVAEDVLILSQHTHIPLQISHGEPVRPFPTIEQEAFTRSLVFPRWVSALLLHIDAHELHHMYPFVPGYRLGGVAYETTNEIGLWTWIVRARALPGEVLLFHNRLETGADI